MKRLYAAENNAFSMVISVDENGTIRWCADGDLYDSNNRQIDIDNAFHSADGAADSAKAAAWLKTVEDDSSWEIYENPDDESTDLFWDGVDIIAEIDTDI